MPEPRVRPLARSPRAVGIVAAWALGSALGYFGLMWFASAYWPVGLSMRFSTDSRAPGAENGVMMMVLGVGFIGFGALDAGRSRPPRALTAVGLVAQVVVAVAIVTSNDSRTCAYDVYGDARYCVSPAHAIVRDGLLYVVPALMALALAVWSRRHRALSGRGASARSHGHALRRAGRSHPGGAPGDVG